MKQQFLVLGLTLVLFTCMIASASAVMVTRETVFEMIYGHNKTATVVALEE